MRFKEGDRVKLKESVAKTFMKPSSPHKRNWVARKGTVVRYAHVTGDVSILWDDRKSWDMWPSAAVEMLDANSH
jgi:hypothetical protein